jgi:hypothetical protein
MNNRRSVVQRWQAVPIAPKAIARRLNSRSAEEQTTTAHYVSAELKKSVREALRQVRPVPVDPTTADTTEKVHNVVHRTPRPDGWTKPGFVRASEVSGIQIACVSGTVGAILGSQRRGIIEDILSALEPHSDLEAAAGPSK